MRASTVVVGVNHFVVILQALCHVIGVENGYFRCATQAFRAHHGDVHPTDRENAGAAIRGRTDWADRMLARGEWAQNRMTWQEVREPCNDADRTHARTAAAVRNAERLVQIQVANIRADIAWARNANLRIHVGAVHIDEPAVGVNDVTQFANAIFEHAVRTWVRHHAGREILSVKFRLHLQVGNIDVAVSIAINRNNGHASDHRACRIGAVRTIGNQADRSSLVTAVVVVRANHHEAGVLALRTSVRLQTDGGETGDFAEPCLEGTEQIRVALPLIGRRKRMNLAKARPGDRHHFAGGVQLHGA